MARKAGATVNGYEIPAQTAELTENNWEYQGNFEFAAQHRGRTVPAAGG
jgi:hypothetical protein